MRRRRDWKRGSSQRRYLRMAHTSCTKSKTIPREILLLALLNSLPLALPPLVPCVGRQEKGANRRKRPPPGSIWRVRVDEPTAQAKPKDEADSSHDAFHASPAPGGVGRIVAPPIRIDTRCKHLLTRLLAKPAPGGYSNKTTCSKCGAINIWNHSLTPVRHELPSHLEAISRMDTEDSDKQFGEQQIVRMLPWFYHLFLALLNEWFWWDRLDSHIQFSPLPFEPPLQNT